MKKRKRKKKKFPQTGPRPPYQMDYSEWAEWRKSIRGKKIENPRQSISLADRRALSAMPCVICAGTFRIQIDHIKPVSKGGSSRRANLQPLCWQCNLKKRNRLTNAQLRAWFRANRKAHRAKAAYFELSVAAAFI